MRLFIATITQLLITNWNFIMTHSNPLLAKTALPLFTQIKPEHVLPAIQSRLEHLRQTVASVLQNETFTWENLVNPLEEAEDLFNRSWSPISHLNAVKNSPELREAYESCLPILSEYSTWIGQHKGLFDAYQQLKSASEFATYSKAQQKTIDNALLDFKLSGIDLPTEKQKRYGEIEARLSELSSKFSNHVLDATMGFTKLIADESELAGLPQSALEAAKALAQAKGQTGFLLTLEMPSYLPLMMYCQNRALRYEFYQAYVTRASDQGPNAGKWDNGPIIDEILTLKTELAQLLEFETYADRSLVTKMAESPAQVIAFLTDLAKLAKPQGEKELAQLTAFAQQQDQLEKLEPWDIAYYSEQQKQALYTIDDEQLRPYFPEAKVISGLFEVVYRLFGITIKQRQGVEVWNENVRFYDIFNQQGDYQASFYLDLYAREHKQGGAWMNDFVTKMQHPDGTVQHPVAYLTCNFPSPVGDKPALFTHNDVTTLFHEFGHGLHHMLSEITVPSVSGIHGVPWDAVELPSQFLENWCWDKEALQLISGHYETGETLPEPLLDKMLEAKNYQAGLFILRQVEFGLFDLTLHSALAQDRQSVLETLKAVQQLVTVVPTVAFGRFPHSFSHIFAGGYAAGYYSYLWAEVLSADAFSRFEEEGIFNPETGQAFLEAILSQGGSESPMTLFKRFRGREPKTEMLLRHYGIGDSAPAVQSH